MKHAYEKCDIEHVKARAGCHLKVILAKKHTSTAQYIFVGFFTFVVVSSTIPLWSSSSTILTWPSFEARCSPLSPFWVREENRPHTGGVLHTLFLSFQVNNYTWIIFYTQTCEGHANWHNWFVIAVSEAPTNHSRQKYLHWTPCMLRIRVVISKKKNIYRDEICHSINDDERRRRKRRTGGRWQAAGLVVGKNTSRVG